MLTIAIIVYIMFGLFIVWFIIKEFNSHFKERTEHEKFVKTLQERKEKFNKRHEEFEERYVNARWRSKE